MLKDYLSKLLALALVISVSAAVTAQNVTITAPMSVAGDYPTIQAAFGPWSADQVAEVVEIDDGMGATVGCDAASNDLTGKIALIDRGACAFTQKAFNAEAAGAIGVIICNSLADFPDSIIVMGGGDGCALTIPATMMSYGDCQTIRAELGNGLTASLNSNLPNPGDDIGNEIILPGAGTYQADTIVGTTVFGDSEHAQYYVITAPSDGVMNVNTCGNGVDTRVSVLQGCRNVLSLVGQNDDACELAPGAPEYASNLDVIVYGGEEYIIVFDDPWTATGPEFDVSFGDLPNVDVTVSVDMQDVTVDPAGAYIAGEMNGWTPEPMTDNMDGTYSFTFSTLAGTAVQYKFLNGPDGWESGAALEACGVDNGMGDFNRTIFPGLDGANAGLVCFESCAVCPPDVACPEWVKDDFEGFALGTIGDQDANDAWTTWSNDPGGAEDGLVTDEQAFSGVHSLNISEAGGDDVIMDHGLRDAGNFILKWKMYVPAGSAGYWGTMKTLATLPGPGIPDLGIQVNMATDGTVTMDAGGAGAFTFTMPQDEWFDVYHVYDLDNSIGKLLINGEEMAQWNLAWDIFNQTDAGAVTVAGIDFYGNTGNNYYVDDILFKEIESCPADAIICDGFDGYDLGTPGPQAPHWTTWSFAPGTGEDGEVVNEAQLSCEQSLKISEAGGDDVILLLGERTTGNYTLSWNMWVPSGSGAYYNLQKTTANLPAPPTADFGIQVALNVDGTVAMDAGGAAAFTFDYPHDEWFELSHALNVDEGTGSLSLNGTEVATWMLEWDIFNQTAGPISIGGVDFFGNTDNLYYVDDLYFIEEESTAAPTVAVTFQVDMSNESVAGDGVYIAGEMNGWSGESMTDMGGGIWAATYDIDPMAVTQIQYKFQNGSGGWENSDLLEPCGVDDGQGGFNRISDIPMEDVTFDAVCFRNCVTCDLVSAEEAAFAASLGISPNPASNVVNVSYNFENMTDLNIRVVNNFGQVISNSFISSALAGNHQVDVSTLPTGIYNFVFTDGEVVVSKRVVVE